MPSLAPIGRFIPTPDIRERHTVVVRAPAPLVLETARRLDLRKVPLVRSIFWLRARLMGSEPVPVDWAGGFVTQAVAMGWQILIDEEGRFLLAGAACQPWLATVVFRPIPAAEFADYAEPDQVKIVWTMEAQALGPELTRFATETRAVATDLEARRKFRRYWRLFRMGILAIRRLMLPVVRREAEREWRRSTAEPAG